MAVLRATLMCAAAVVAGVVLWIVKMPGKSYKGPLPPLTEYERELRGRLVRHVRTLASDIGGRSIGKIAGLDAAAEYIRNELRSFGYTPVDQPFRVQSVEVPNIEVEIAGAARPSDIAVIGAHYDTAGGLPGANDNGTGVAAAFEIARALANSRPEQTVRFVFFVNEEPPYFQTEYMGSLVYANRCAERREDINAMVSLETIGYYSDEPGSQVYPAGLHFGFPNTANFISFVSNVKSRSLLTRAIRSFREHAQFPSEGAAAPGAIAGVGWSDHWSFWQHGYPAIMVTDTAPFRYPYYHTAQDTPDKIDFDRFARVTRGLIYVASDLAGLSFPGR